VAGFVLFSGGDDGRTDGGETTAKPQRETTPRDPTPTPTAERTPEPTAEPTAEPTVTAAPETPAQPDLALAGRLQVQGYDARIAGDYEQALALNQQALEACRDTVRLDPCGFALYEVGAALNALGRPDEAIAPLEQRLELYGDNNAREVEAELRKARKATGRGKGDD
jgi:tetratricopeptide (TPR) repeat protein